MTKWKFPEAPKLEHVPVDEAHYVGILTGIAEMLYEVWTRPKNLETKAPVADPKLPGPPPHPVDDLSNFRAEEMINE